MAAAIARVLSHVSGTEVEAKRSKTLLYFAEWACCVSALCNLRLGFERRIFLRPTITPILRAKSCCPA
jgi:hypothetical protein